jgi:hypothetical protein
VVLDDLDDSLAEGVEGVVVVDTGGNSYRVTRVLPIDHAVGMLACDHTRLDHLDRTRAIRNRLVLGSCWGHRNALQRVLYSSKGSWVDCPTHKDEV